MIRMALCLCLVGHPLAMSAEDSRCNDNQLVALGSEREDVRDACEAAVVATRFFEVSGLPVPRDLRITIVDAQDGNPLNQGETGRYDARLSSIRVLSYTSAIKATESNEPGLGRIATRPHWRSYVAHELAHAAIHTGCDRTCPTRAIHEYVAAVAQIANLTTDQRSVLLAHYADLEPFHEVSDISETYYAINPHYFAVKSYKHFLKQADPRAFFRNLLQLPP